LSPPKCASPFVMTDPLVTIHLGLKGVKQAVSVPRRIPD
jgi:hypothetical protein